MKQDDAIDDCIQNDFPQFRQGKWADFQKVGFPGFGESNGSTGEFRRNPVDSWIMLKSQA